MIRAHDLLPLVDDRPLARFPRPLAGVGEADDENLLILRRLDDDVVLHTTITAVPAAHEVAPLLVGEVRRLGNAVPLGKHLLP